ncbi:ABC transporter substrate-binding protein [Pararobbsia silviterrae]|uniref:ABC transporter substrate-binding protein n=1 Tax=Pararobbsia silviterrae TaxID=1792498 RepID=A0A494XRN5_9BURK|nr:ABC transporter substrate-binding protein [Pararobbsia silviterrae]RKP53288.1 ABC transporter substrate-binding protein [Pararobbsia silviterrae]
MSKVNGALTGAFLVASLIAGQAHAEAAQSTATAGIALSNSYAGNTWRQQMIGSWQTTTKDAIAHGVIAKTKVVNANNSAPEQASQIQNLILEGWKSIVIDAASPTALNGVIQQACTQGIVVVTFDGLATAPCAYKVSYDYSELGRQFGEFVVKKLNGKGNVLMVTGLPGTSIDADVQRGAKSVLDKNPGIKIVGSVVGSWTESTAQKEVAGILPSLPPVDAVLAQGGDGFGVYQAFKDAGRKVPLITVGGRHEELAMWKQLTKDEPGYETTSAAAVPGISSIAFWVAQQVLAGRKVPKEITVPFMQISQPDLDKWLAATPEGMVASPDYTKDYVEKLIATSSGQHQ